MTKWLIHGDPHLKISHLLTAREFFTWIKRVASEYDVKGIINLGDLFDTHGVVRAEVQGEYREFLNNRGKLTYIHILGNHECFKPNDARYHALQPFIERNDNDYHVVDRPMIIEDMGFVPYIHDASNFPDLDAEIVFAHQTFLGSDFGHFRPEEGVDPESLRAELIYSGHIHTRQNVGKVRYVGSPIPYGVNDADQTKGIVIFDTETLKETFIPSPFPSWRSLTIDLATPNALECLVLGVNKTDNWVVDVVGPRLEVAEFLDSKAVSAIRKTIKVRFRSKTTDSGKEKVSIKAMSIPDMIVEYIEKIYAGNIDKELLKAETLKLIGE